MGLTEILGVILIVIGVYMLIAGGSLVLALVLIVVGAFALLAL